MGECLIMRRGGETYKLPVLDEYYPKDVTTTVIKGNTTSATFTAQISEAGTPAIYTYQWYVNGSKVSGATSSSYTKSDLSTTATYSVYCEITNKAGTVQTRVATLKVTQYYTPVLNTSYPANVTGASIGGSATFKVTIATAGVPASYTYQWYVNNTAVSGATSSSYTRSNLAKGTYSVYCKVTSSAGTVQSRTATLTVTKLYLYNSGDLCSSATGGWNSVTDSYCTYSTSPNLSMYYTNAIGNYGGFHTKNMIDLSGFNTLYGKCVVTRPPNAWQKFGVRSGTGARDGFVASVDLASSGTLSVDISNVSTAVYVGFACLYYGGADFSEIWVE